jgi:alpha-amylase
MDSLFKQDLQPSISINERKITPTNSTLLEGFEWHVPADGKHWKRLYVQLAALKSIGISNIWLPPGCKGWKPDGNGYDIYDLWDLGEFDQKGSVATKWGAKSHLVRLAQKAKEYGVGLYWDAVLSHKAGADNLEVCQVMEVNGNDTIMGISKPFEIEAWFGFDFKGRRNKYSEMKWHWYHFTGTDWDQRTQKKAIYKVLRDKKKGSKLVDDDQRDE